MLNAQCSKITANLSVARPACLPLLPAGSKAFVAPSSAFKTSHPAQPSSVPVQRRSSTIVRATMAGRTSDPLDLTSERSPLVNREVVLFLFQLEMDSQLQRALTYEDFELGQDIRRRRQQVDDALRELQESKGYGCGALGASRSAKFDNAPMALSLRHSLSTAIHEERYTEAASLRDRIAELEDAAAEAELPCPVVEPRFSLGQMVVHASKGYRGVVCGWDLACCESDEWRSEAGLSYLKSGSEQVFYQVLVDGGDWPVDLEEPPVAYVAEELLDEASLANFAAAEPLVDSSFQHPYAYLMFLGSDGHGNMIPCRQLREKYCIERTDRYAPWQEEESTDSEEGGNGGGDNNNNGGGDDGPVDLGDGIVIDRDSDLWGKSRIPGIDMSSLD